MEEIHSSEMMWEIESNWNVGPTGLLEKFQVEAEVCEL